MLSTVSCLDWVLLYTRESNDYSSNYNSEILIMIKSSSCNFWTLRPNADFTNGTQQQQALQITISSVCKAKVTTGFFNRPWGISIIICLTLTAQRKSRWVSQLGSFVKAILSFPDTVYKLSANSNSKETWKLVLKIHQSCSFQELL